MAGGGLPPADGAVGRGQQVCASGEPATAQGRLPTPRSPTTAPCGSHQALLTPCWWESEGHSGHERDSQGLCGPGGSRRSRMFVGSGVHTEGKEEKHGLGWAQRPLSKPRPRRLQGSVVSGLSEKEAFLSIMPQRSTSRGRRSTTGPGGWEQECLPRPCASEASCRGTRA